MGWHRPLMPERHRFFQALESVPEQPSGRRIGGRLNPKRKSYQELSREENVPSRLLSLLLFATFLRQGDEMLWAPTQVQGQPVTRTTHNRLTETHPETCLRLFENVERHKCRRRERQRQAPARRD